MPIFTAYLLHSEKTESQVPELLIKATKFAADTLNSPIERIRAGVVYFEQGHWYAGGKPVNADGDQIPFFEMYALEGRPKEQRQALLSGLTDIIAETLDIEKKVIRGCIKRIHSEDWGIGGTPASELRAREIAARITNTDG